MNSNVIKINSNEIKIPWTEKYRPITSDQVCGNVREFEKVKECGIKHVNLLLHGPSGTGKSSALKVILKNIPDDCKLILDTRTRSSGSTQNIVNRMTNFILRKSSSKIRYVLVDEVDSFRIVDQRIFIRPLTRENNGIRLIFLFTCNRIELVSEFIVRNCTVIEYNSLNYNMVQNYLRKICENENIKFNSNSLQKIFNAVNCDMRKMISTMQYLYLMTGSVDFDEFIKNDTTNVSNYANLFEKIFSIKDIIKSTNYVYRQSFSVNTLCIFSLEYHSKLEKLTYEYVKILANICNDSLSTDDTWFLIYYMIKKSPIYQSYFLESF